MSTPADIAAANPAAPAAANAPWSGAHKILFRFFACLIFLLVFPFPFSTAPGSVYNFVYLDRAEFRVANWIGPHIFHVAATPQYFRDYAFLDANAGYIELLLVVVVSIVTTIVWSLLDRRRGDYRRLHEYLRWYVRYALALNMFAYGWDKVLALQFSWSLPGPQRLAEPLGNYSPFALMWTFMGYSKPYTIFAGIGEVAGGALLFFRRTTALGAMIVAFVMANVVMMNFSYGVPVKIFSSSLLLLAVFLLAPDAARILDFFVFNRPTPAAANAGAFRKAWIVKWSPYIGAAALALATYWFAGPELNPNRKRANEPKSPVYGLYQVESFTQGGKSLMDGDQAWRKVISESPEFLAVLTNDDSQLFFDTKYDAAKSSVTISDNGDAKNPPTRQMTYAWRDPAHLELRGTFNNEPLEIELRKIEIAKTTLLSRGFHWSENGGFYR